MFHPLNLNLNPIGNPMLNFSFAHNLLKLYKYHKMGMNKQIRGGFGVKEAGWTRA
jgi:hypothetical protein